MDLEWIVLLVVVYELGALATAYRFWAREGDERSRGHPLFLLIAFVIVGQIGALMAWFSVLYLALKLFFTTLLIMAVWLRYWIERILWGVRTKDEAQMAVGVAWQSLVKSFNEVFPEPADNPTR